jgi:hypothetical protein
MITKLINRLPLVSLLLIPLLQVNIGCHLHRNYWLLTVDGKMLDLQEAKKRSAIKKFRGCLS